MAEAKKSVLVVDDEEALRYSLRQILELGGYEVHEAAGGEEALTQPDLRGSEAGASC